MPYTNTCNEINKHGLFYLKSSTFLKENKMKKGADIKQFNLISPETVLK